jgi:peptidyl-prolyl cis-trans isomerase A (cyclophilin A)
MIPRVFLVGAVIFSVLVVGGCKHEKPNVTPKPGEGSSSVKRPTAIVETTMGTFKFELYTDKAPITAKNFIDLTNKGFYNGVIFHRVVKDFVIQGGDPTGTGSGGPGHTIKLETSPDLRHDKPGVVAMARTQDPDSAGSQFYVTVVPAPFLDPGPNGPGYAIFGQVIEGMDVVYAINKVDVGANEKPLKDVQILKVTIEQPK